MAIDESTQQANKSQSTTEKSKSFKSLVTSLTIIGILGVFVGKIGLLGTISSGFSAVGLADAIFFTVFSALLFACSRVLAKGKVLVI